MLHFFFSPYQDMLNRQQQTRRQIELISTIDQKKTVVFPSVQWVCRSKQDSEPENILPVLWCSDWFVREGFHTPHLKMICEFRDSGGTVNRTESLQSFNHFYYRFDWKSCAGHLTPPIPLNRIWVSFHQFRNHLWSMSSIIAGEQWAWFLVSLLVFLTGSYNN